MGAGEGKGRFRKAVAKTTLLRQMSSKVLPLTNPEARLSSDCLLYTSPSPRDGLLSRMPSSA